MAAGKATWGAFLRHGFLSGTVAFVLLVLVAGLVPLGDGGAALLAYATMVAVPTLAAHRFAPRAPRRVPRRTGRAVEPAVPKALPRTRPSADEAAQRAVSSYAEMLRLHPYVPGPAADPDDLADYRTALDVYDEARRSSPSRVPELLERGRAALERLEAAGLAGTDISWIRGTGDARVRVPGPGGDGAMLLFFETDDAGAYSVFLAATMGMRQRELLSGAVGPFHVGTVRARVLVPGGRGAELLDVRSAGRWRIALRPAAETRRLEEGVPLKGQGTETVLVTGGRGVVEFEHRGDGAFAVHEVTASYRTGRLVADGRDEARLTVAVPGRCLLRVDAAGRWALRAVVATGGKAG